MKNISVMALMGFCAGFSSTLLADDGPKLAYTNGDLNLSAHLLLDVGVTYMDNQEGQSYVDTPSGIQSPNLVGIAGSYVLQDGYKAIFELENQFSVDQGETIGEGIFSRQAYAGISTPYGTLTNGDQYEFMFQSLSAERWGDVLPSVSLYQMQEGPFQNLGLPGRPIDFNRTAGAYRVARSIKYASPNISGFTFGGLYGRGDDNESNAFAKTVSLGMGYGNGPLQLNAAYTNARNIYINEGRDGIRNWGAGGLYRFDSFVVDAVYTNTTNTFTDGAIDVYAVGTKVPFGKKISLYANYQFMNGNAELGDNRAHQLGATLDYRINSVADVYVTAVYQKAAGDDDPKALIPAMYAASDDTAQAALRVGLRLFFY